MNRVTDRHSLPVKNGRQQGRPLGSLGGPAARGLHVNGPTTRGLRGANRADIRRPVTDLGPRCLPAIIPHHRTQDLTRRPVGRGRSFSGCELTLYTPISAQRRFSEMTCNVSMGTLDLYLLTH